MFRALVTFYWVLLQQSTWQPAYLVNQVPNGEHFHQRRFTDRYQQKKRLVRSLWFTMALVVMAFPAPQFAFAVLLLTTFVSFSILDETD